MPWIYTSSIGPMAAVRTLPVDLILDGHARTDFNGPLDYCKWFPLYGPLCSGVGILVFGSASKFPISMAKDEATSRHLTTKVATTWCITTPAYSFAFQQFLGKATWTRSMSSVTSYIKIGFILVIFLTCLLEEHEHHPYLSA